MSDTKCDWRAVLRDYRKGLTLRQCATRHGVSMQRVHQIVLKHAPEDMRSPYLSAKSRLSEKDLAEILNVPFYYGVNIDLSAKYGVSTSYIAQLRSLRGNPRKGGETA